MSHARQQRSSPVSGGVRAFTLTDDGGRYCMVRQGVDNGDVVTGWRLKCQLDHISYSRTAYRKTTTPWLENRRSSTNSSVSRKRSGKNRLPAPTTPGQTIICSSSIRPGARLPRTRPGTPPWSKSMTRVHLRRRVHHQRKPERRETVRRGRSRSPRSSRPRCEEHPAPELARRNRRAGAHDWRPLAAGWRGSPRSGGDRIVREPNPPATDNSLTLIHPARAAPPSKSARPEGNRPQTLVLVAAHLRARRLWPSHRSWPLGLIRRCRRYLRLIDSWSRVWFHALEEVSSGAEATPTSMLPRCWPRGDTGLSSRICWVTVRHDFCRAIRFATEAIVDVDRF